MKTYYTLQSFAHPQYEKGRASEATTRYVDYYLHYTTYIWRLTKDFGLTSDEALKLYYENINKLNIEVKND